jgi:hypothetical protein
MSARRRLRLAISLAIFLLFYCRGRSGKSYSYARRNEFLQSAEHRDSISMQGKIFLSRKSAEVVLQLSRFKSFGRVANSDCSSGFGVEIPT